MKQFLGTILEKLMKAWSWITLILLVILIKLSSLYSGFIEQYYSNGIYPAVSKIQRFLFGWLPFSLGDLVYGFFILVILVKTFQLLKILFRRKYSRRYLLEGLKQIIFFFLFVYVFFYLLWGLNYSRKGIATQLDLKMTRYSLAELDTLTNVLEQRLNYYAGLVEPPQRDSFYKKRNLFRESYEAYKMGVQQYPFLNYKPRSIKPSLFSYVGNILGFEGYYNPFSGEGQVNTTIPVFICIIIPSILS